MQLLWRLQEPYQVSIADYMEFAMHSMQEFLHSLKKTSICCCDQFKYQHAPDYGRHGPNVSTEAVPLEETNSRKETMRFRYLYQKRNRFTHRLEQNDRGSAPFASLLPGLDRAGANENAASWMIEIREGKPVYMCGLQEVKYDQGEQVHYVFRAYDWPFLLFEVLHSAIGASFDRTDIHLTFHVTKECGDQVMRWPSVGHKEIRLLCQDPGSTL